MPINQSINHSINQNLLYRADCKEALLHLIENNIKVDLIYLDPPFNSSRTYNIIFSSRGITAQQKAFHDMWTINPQTRQLLLNFEDIIENSNELSIVVKDFLRAWVAPLKDGNVQDKKMLIYLVYMTERLILMKRVLKETGSIYYHCDPTASHYIKIVMDGIFGRENFRNEIIWSYNRFSRRGNAFPSMHDTLLFYTKSQNYHFEIQYTERRDGTRYKRGYQTVVDRGVKKLLIYDESLASKIDKSKYDKIVTTQAQKPIMGSDWLDIPILNSQSKERRGYPTQKPLALLDRVVKASCPEGGTVLDPFCGCGTTVHSAIQNNRKWIGIDISSNAAAVIRERIKEIGAKEGKEYQFIDGSPETKNEYETMDPFQKQEWLIDRVGGFPNPKKSGDGGVDGEMTIHLGFTEEGKDKWGKMIFSVKTGRQCKPEFIRELIGTMKLQKAVIGGLILEADPTENMEITAHKKGQLKYQYAKDLPPQYYDCVQIRTVDEILDGKCFDTPPTLKRIQLYRGKTPTLGI